MERPAESVYYVAQQLEFAMSLCEQYPNDSDIKASLVEWIKKTVDLLRWYDWEEEQRRRQSLKGS